MTEPDVERQPWRVRCAQPPYDSLPIPRADIPTGIILSRDADAWIRDGKVEDVALPLYEGRMIGQFDFSKKAWLSGKGRSAEWPEVSWDQKTVGPQFLMAIGTYREQLKRHPRLKVTSMDVTSSTNARTVIATALGDQPCGHKTPVLLPSPASEDAVLALVGIMNSFAFDYVVRCRLGGTSLIWAVLQEAALPTSAKAFQSALANRAARLALCGPGFAPSWNLHSPWRASGSWRGSWNVTALRRASAQAELDALVAHLFGLTVSDFRHVLAQCDQAGENAGGAPNGFWRVDKKKDPELRQTVLALVTVADLESKIRAAGGDRQEGLEEFLGQNDGEGWTLPEALRLADYGLGHDERAQHPQPVASCLGPRFYDWQLAQTAEESWRECALHASNLSGGSPPSPSVISEPQPAATKPSLPLFGRPTD